MSEHIRQALAEKFEYIYLQRDGMFTIQDAIDGAMEIIDEMFGGLEDV